MFFFTTVMEPCLSSILMYFQGSVGWYVKLWGLGMAGQQKISVCCSKPQAWLWHIREWLININNHWSDLMAANDWSMCYRIYSFLPSLYHFPSMFYLIFLGLSFWKMRFAVCLLLTIAKALFPVIFY